MSAPTHPSFEELSAYHDAELAPDRRAAVESHLADCPACRAVLEEFTALEALGTSYSDRLPGASYWLDLPDRVLARIAETGNPGPVRAGERSSFWRKLWNPQGAWRWAAATAAAVVVIGGAWAAFHEAQNPVTPLPAELAEQQAPPVHRAPRVTPRLVGNDLVAGGPAMEDMDNAPVMNPDSFARRVVMTLGGENNLGTSLDMQAGRAIQPTGVSSPMGTQVTFNLPPLAPQSRREMQSVVSCGPGESAVQRALVAAAKAEEMGNTALARQGYLLVRKLSNPDHPLYREADYRLTYARWRQRVASASPGPARARVLVDLQDQAQRSYESWARTGNVTDCWNAWQLNRTLVHLGTGIVPASQLAQASLRLRRLSACISR